MNRILIVSDDIFLRDMVRLSLIDMHTEVRCAADADEMEGLCRRVLFDLVIVLHVAPFLCGRDVVRSVRPAGLRRPLFYVVSWLQSEQAVLSLPKPRPSRTLQTRTPPRRRSGAWSTA